MAEKRSRVGETKRQLYSTQQLIDRTVDLPEDYESLEKIYRTLAKAADQRLVRLERAADLPDFGHATQWAYARAQRDIEEWSGEGATRFNTKPPANKAKLTQKIEDIRTFLSSPTSTKKGIKDTLKKRADTLNDKYGTNFKWNEVGKFFQGSLGKKLDSRYGSDTILYVVAKLQKNKSKILKAMKDTKKKDIRVPDSDTVLEKITNRVINKYGKEVAEFLKDSK